MQVLLTPLASNHVIMLNLFWLVLSKYTYFLLSGIETVALASLIATRSLLCR
jgi:hypothetical protein